MKKKSWAWPILAGLALTSTAVLGVGSYMAIAGPGASNATPVLTQQEAQPVISDAEKKAQPYLIVGLGDSLTKGVGDTTAKGYVGFLKEKLEAQGRQVLLQNFGISGQESDELLKSLQGQGYREQIAKAKLVTVTIGANDLTHSIGNVGELFTAANLDVSKLTAAQEQYAKNLAEILTLVRSANADAPILLLGLYNPFEGMLAEREALITDQLTAWNSNVMAIVQKVKNVKVVPTADIFQGNTNFLLSVDHFHPNTQGYEKMADRLLQALPVEE